MRATTFLSIACVGLAPAETIRIDAAPAHATNSFSPTRALGAGVDRLSKGSTDKLLSEPILKEVLSAGWQTVSYRQNTELHAEAWHWNPSGTWSDPAGKGYFTGSATPGEAIRHSFGYSLPHRGFSRGDGDGYSRLTDGDPDSHWKSNPYLTRAFTGEDDALHPQWIVADLGSKQPVSAIRIAWAAPYAKTYYVQFWTGEDDPLTSPVKGIWQTFPSGRVSDGKGGAAVLPLVSSAFPVRFLRILMTESSNTCDTHGLTDRRLCVGYAIRELYIGTLDASGGLQDIVKHSANRQQTVTTCSSVDPWHQASDLNDRAGDQAGLDFFYTSGVTRGLPAMIPVAMLYGTPEDAAAEIAYLKRRHYPISYVEMGEEPDGQHMLPEDYGALYLQFATAIHRVDPALKLGGPAFEGVNEDVAVWPDAQGRVSWLGRFLDYLKAHRRLQDFAFFSFEHYPFDPCHTEWTNLYEEPKRVSHILDVWREDGLPADTPRFITEVNLSWQTGETYVDILGGLWEADYVGAFLTGGGSATYYFHYLPLPLSRGCEDSWGTFGMLLTDSDYQTTRPTSQFFVSQLIAKEWVLPGDGVHRVFRAASDVTDSAGNVVVTAYAVLRPDDEWSLLVVNKDHDNSHTVQIAFQDGSDRPFAGPVTMTTFGSEQYQWHPKGRDGYADPAGPPASSTIASETATQYTLPKASITVLRGKLGR